MFRSYSKPSQDDPTKMRHPDEIRQWMDQRKRDAERAYAYALATGNKREADIFKFAAEELINNQNPMIFEAIARLKKTPATIEEFCESPEFLANGTDEPVMGIWPTLMPIIAEMNPDVMIGQKPVTQALMGGATGWGKTHAAQVTCGYQLYLLTCFNNPHRMFNLNPTTPIVTMFMSVSGTITKRVIYQPFRQMFTNMKYSQKWLKWDRHKDSELVLEGNLLAVPALAALNSMVGQAIAGGILDELAFMSIVENSKQVAGPTGQGGRYDQAEIVFGNITRRRARSFTTKGISIGCICAPSSTRYKGDFIDRRMREVDEAKAEGRPQVGVLSMRKKQYDVAPQHRNATEHFRLLVGTDDYQTRILKDEELPGINYPENAQVENVPMAYYDDFRRDPEGATRDVIGVASNSITPFFAQRHKIIECILAGKEAGLAPFVVKSDVVLSEDGMPRLDEALMPLDRDAMRFIHVDLSRSGDATGIAMVKYDGHVPVPNPSQPGFFDLLPKFTVEMAVSIKPDSAHHIDPAEVRQWIMQLVSFHGFNIQQVSYDSWGSNESLSLFRTAGVGSKEISVDRTMDPYETFKSTVYDGRVQLPDDELMRLEMISLEYIAEKDKVDHPPKGSKDKADAICGAIFAATRHRTIRMYNVVVDAAGRPAPNKVIEQRREPVRASGLKRTS